jgi:ectoine hydroxylase-related dioxygenase (phytanoyl-CoA dioxygenase family)
MTMMFSAQQVNQYEENGYLLLDSCFSPRELGVLTSELPEILGEESPRRVLEKDGVTVRSVYGPHITSEVFRCLSQHPQLVAPSMDILGSDVYLYQFKINVKAGFGGDVWEWHQDYIFWQREDGMPEPRAINAAVFLDEVTEFNGPLFVLPGSHKEGVILPSKTAEALSVTFQRDNYAASDTWVKNLSARLNYSLDRDIMRELVWRYRMASPKGPAGSVLFFHPNLVHGSAMNMSPFDRVIAYLTFNSVHNSLPEVANPRPDFLVGRHCEPIRPLPADILLQKYMSCAAN